MKKSKIISMLLAVSMIFGCMSCVWAIDPSDGDYPFQYVSGDTATTPVKLTQEAQTFSVSVPLFIPISVAENGTATIPDVEIINNNPRVPVEIKNIEITGKNGWTKTENKDGWQANDKKFVMTLDYSGDQVTNCTFAVPPQTTAITGSEIADVVFTVGWADVQSGTTSTNPNPD